MIEAVLSYAGTRATVYPLYVSGVVAVIWIVLLVVLAFCELASGPLHRTRNKYTQIRYYLSGKHRKSGDVLLELKAKLDQTDYEVEGWREERLKVLQEASEIEEDADLTNLVGNRLGDLVRRTVEIVSPDERRSLVDQITVFISDYPELRTPRKET